MNFEHIHSQRPLGKYHKSSELGMLRRVVLEESAREDQYEVAETLPACSNTEDGRIAEVNYARSSKARDYAGRQVPQYGVAQLSQRGVQMACDSELAFEDLLVSNTYEGEPLTSQETEEVRNKASLAFQMTGQTQGVETMTVGLTTSALDDREDLYQDVTDETNLLDETSRFEKNLNICSDESLSGIGQNQMHKQRLGVRDIQCIPDHSGNFKGKFSQISDPQKLENLRMSSRTTEDYNLKSQFLRNFEKQTTSTFGKENRYTAFPDQTTTTSQHDNNMMINGASHDSIADILKRGSHIGAGLCLKNDSTVIFKSPEAPSSQHESNHFITFKPASQVTSVAFDGQGSQLNSTGVYRNPFPHRQRQPSTLSDKSETCSPTKLGESKECSQLKSISFQDNIKQESECYDVQNIPNHADRPVQVIAINSSSASSSIDGGRPTKAIQFNMTAVATGVGSPNVISQHSNDGTSQPTGLNNASSMSAECVDPYEQAINNSGQTALTMSQLGQDNSTSQNSSKNNEVVMVSHKQHLRSSLDYAENLPLLSSIREEAQNQEDALKSTLHQRKVLSHVPSSLCNLAELPSRIVEDSQEYSYSYANAKRDGNNRLPTDGGQYTTSQSLNCNEDERQKQSSSGSNNFKNHDVSVLKTTSDEKIVIGSRTESIVNTQDSEVKSLPQMVMIANNNTSVSSKAHSVNQTEIQHPYRDHSKNSTSVEKQILEEKSIETRSNDTTTPLQTQSVLSVDCRGIEFNNNQNQSARDNNDNMLVKSDYNVESHPKQTSSHYNESQAYISVGSHKASGARVKLNSRASIKHKNESISSPSLQQKMALQGAVSERYMGVVDDQEAKHHKSTTVVARQQQDHTMKHKYSQSSTPGLVKQQKDEDAALADYSEQMRDLANALLHQLNSQFDHFSQADLALLTSISQSNADEGQSQEEPSDIDPLADTPVDSDDKLPPATNQAKNISLILQSETFHEVSGEHSMKELYERRMRQNKKRAATVESKGRTIRRKPQPVAMDRQQRIEGSSQSILKASLDTEMIRKDKSSNMQLVNDFYERNIAWKKQLDSINRSKKQVIDAQTRLKERAECTFKPKLVTEKFNKQLELYSVAIKNGLDLAIDDSKVVEASKEVVEDRCLQWADFNKKKQEKAQKSQARDAECTFAPLLISKEFKNRVCPNYDLKLKDLQETSSGLLQEYNYFTLRNYLQMNSESKQDLERLCRLYSTEGGNSFGLNNSSSPQNALNLSSPDGAAGKVRVTPDQIKSDRERMLQIAEFLERSEAWHKDVVQRRQQLAKELEKERDAENTFHPKINTTSQVLHSKKLNMLEKVNIAAQIQVQEQEGANMFSQQTKENLFEYYLPQSKLTGQASNLEFEKQEIRDKCRSNDAPLQIQANKEIVSKQAFKHEKRGNKDSDNASKRAEVDCLAESQKFKHLIDLINDKLEREKHQFSNTAYTQNLPLQLKEPTNLPRNEKKGDKNNSIQKQRVNQRAYSVSKTDSQHTFNEQISFQHQSLDREIELINNVQNLMQIDASFRDPIQTSSAKNQAYQLTGSAQSEETSRFQNVAADKIQLTNFGLNDVKQLDLSKLSQESGNDNRENIQDAIQSQNRQTATMSDAATVVLNHGHSMSASYENYLLMSKNSEEVVYTHSAQSMAADNDIVLNTDQSQTNQSRVPRTQSSQSSQ